MKPPYRMKQLCQLTGLSRQAIHFYIQKGLVPRGQKGGMTSALYGDEHVERILAVRRMQADEFLPLEAIRATFDRRDQGFSSAQQRVIAGVRERFTVPAAGRSDRVVLSAAARRAGVDPRDATALVQVGLLSVTRDKRGRRCIARDQTWVLSAWVDLRQAGFTRELGFSPTDLASHQEALGGLVQREAALLSTRLADLPPAEAAALVSRALPIIGALLARLHTVLVQRLLGA